MTFIDIHELLVSSVSPLLLRDFIKFIAEYNDSQAYVEESMESDAVAKISNHENVLRNGIPNSE